MALCKTIENLNAAMISDGETGYKSCSEINIGSNLMQVRMEDSSILLYTQVNYNISLYSGRKVKDRKLEWSVIGV